MNWDKKDGDPDTFLDAVIDPEVDVPKRAKPDISMLEDALEVDDEGNVKFLPIVGGKVVIERQFEGQWLDTNLYTVTAIDPETGALRLIRDEFGHQAMSNYMEAILRGHIFKLPPKKGPIVKRKVRVSRKSKEKETITIPDPNQPKRGRGRPKGSKNRPKDVIKVEKVQGKKSGKPV